MNKLFVPALLALLFVAPSSFAEVGSELDMDFDGDGIVNRFDNCYLYSNPSQFDADADGFGNACDSDLNNDGVVNLIDLSLLSEVFLTSDTTADFNEDGIVNFLDFWVFRRGFNNGRPGPGLVMHWVGGNGFWNERTNWFPQQVPSSPLYEYAVIDTPEGVVVTVESEKSAGAKSLTLDGELVVCGSLNVGVSTTVNGSLSTGCGFGSIYTPQGIDLGGRLTLRSGMLDAAAIRRIDNTDPEFVIDGQAEFGAFDSDTVSTDVDITVQPGATLILGILDNFVLQEASILLNSKIKRWAVVSLFNSTISGTGSIEFNGPASESALGQVQSFGYVELGAGIDIKLEPGAFGYLDSQLTNFGNIAVTDSSTLYFSDFKQVFNSGQITCSNNGRLLEKSPGAFGDSILFNRAEGALVADNCTVRWPTRVINSGRFDISASEMSLPLEDTSGTPLNINSSDISIEATRPTVTGQFYNFDPLLNNTVLLKGLLFLNGETLEIDAAKWRFIDSAELNNAVFDFGTLVSDTPLTVNTGAILKVFDMTFDTQINLEPGSELHLFDGIDITQDISFVEPANCVTPAVSPAVLRFNWFLNELSNNIKINAISSSAAGCLNAEIITEFNNVVPGLIDIVVADASMTIHAESGGRIELHGETTVTGANAELNLRQVLNFGMVSCFEGATVNASGTANNPFVNEQSFSSGECDVNFSDYWINNGSYFSANGTLSLTAPEGTSYIPGAGVFITEGTSVLFDLDISDPSQLNLINVVPLSGGAFTFSGTITNPGPELNLNDFPSDTEFGDGFELADTRVTGFQIFRLSGSTTLRNVELALPTVVPKNSTLNVFDQLVLDDATLVIQSNSLDSVVSTTRLLLHGVSSIAGTGDLILRPLGTGAISELVQTVEDMSLSIDAGITTSCVSGGQCAIKAGAGTGKIDLFGDLFVSDETTVLRLESDATVYRSANLQYQGQMRVANATNLNFSGPESGLEIALFNGPIRPAIVVEGAAAIGISEAFLSFVPGDGYVLPSEEAVTVLSHEGSAERVGEFANVSDALIDGQLFTADYSSPDVTILRGPAFTTQALTN